MTVAATTQGMAAAVEEEAVDGEALCGVVDQTELASVLGLSGSTDPGVADAVAALWAQVQLLQRVGRQGPWAFPTVMPRADAPPVFFVVLGDTGAGKRCRRLRRCQPLLSIHLNLAAAKARSATSPAMPTRCTMHALLPAKRANACLPQLCSRCSDVVLVILSLYL